MFNIILLSNSDKNGNNKPNYKLPKPPNGFEWCKIEDEFIAFLKPKNWFTGIKEENNTIVIGIAKENFNEIGSFKTGLTIFIKKYKGDNNDFVKYL